MNIDVGYSLHSLTEHITGDNEYVEPQNNTLS